ncbi:hypothetical protein ACVILI_004246 [Mesorhizobium sp. USDA 4775]
MPKTGRSLVGMVAGFIPEWWPVFDRNGGRLHVGIRTRDLSGSDTLSFTQEFLAQMLGTQRNSVSIVANTLQHAGLIRYHRGHIEIINVPGLLESTCECYGTVKAYYDKLLRGH